MPTPSQRAVVSCTLCLLLALFFGTIGLAKLVAPAAAQQVFFRWGFPEWFHIFIGVLEVSGAFLLLFRRTSTLASAILAGVMLGAIATHLRPTGQPLMAIMPAALLLPLAAVGFCRRLDACWMRRVTFRDDPRITRRASRPFPSHRRAPDLESLHELRLTRDLDHADVPDSPTHTVFHRRA